MTGPRAMFWLYLPSLPSTRAQCIQVLHAAHAAAVRGHEVTLPYRWSRGRVGGSPASVLAAAELPPLPNLRLIGLPARGLGCSVAYWSCFAAWYAQSGPRDVVIARNKRHAARVLRMTRAKVILEAHEVDSLQAAERGEASAPARRLERAVLAGALGLVANAEGTLALLREVHGPLPPAVVIHNAAQPNRAKRERRAGIGYVGSTLPTKDLHTLARAASLGEHTVTVVGPRGSSDAELRRISADRMVFRPPVPSRDVPALLSGFAALALPLGRGLFGQHLTSPLKLWDYLASGVPVVAADTPSIRAAAPSGWLGYRPGDANHLAAQLHRVLTEPGLADRLVERAPHRDWGQRAAELDRLIDQVLP